MLKNLLFVLLAAFSFTSCEKENECLKSVFYPVGGFAYTCAETPAHALETRSIVIEGQTVCAYLFRYQEQPLEPGTENEYTDEMIKAAALEDAATIENDSLRFDLLAPFLAFDSWIDCRTN